MAVRTCKVCGEHNIESLSTCAICGSSLEECELVGISGPEKIGYSNIGKVNYGSENYRNSYYENPVLVKDEVRSYDIYASAGFGIRFAATIIDSIVFSLIEFVIIFIWISINRISGNIDEINKMLSEPSSALLSTLLWWFSFALFECSSLQATIGKLAVGIKVTDDRYKRISFLRATGRYFGKFLSSIILCIGYIMAAFTHNNQALHDIIAGTYVVHKRPY